MKIVRKIIEIDEKLCNGCGQCVPACAEGALQIVDGKAKLIADIYCDGLGACLGECPTGALRIVERNAEDFDEDAVEKLLEPREEAAGKTTPAPSATGCPSSRLQTFQPNSNSTCETANQPRSNLSTAGSDSSLTHWPVQIRLVPPTAPFLKNADLLVAADCTAFAYPDFHRDFLKDRVVMVGCPKFDETESYINKFAEIFKTANLKSITNVIMEVPCCGSMRMILREALLRAETDMDVEEVVISAQGKILQRGKMAA